MEQLTRDDLATMTPEQIDEARRAGALHRLLTGTEPPPDPETVQVTAADLRTMTPEAIDKARRAGHLDHLITPEDR